jgi:hypothetical protein
MKVKITRDQAVWERETFFVEVPDNTPKEELFEAVAEAVTNFDGYADDGYDKTICDDAVEGIDAQTVAELPDFTTFELT